MYFKKIITESEQSWKKVIEHPFVNEIFKGDLAEDIFKFYLKQDYYYLNKSMETIAILVARAPEIEIKQKLISILHSEANVEFSKYEELLAFYNIQRLNYDKFELSYANIAYSNYLLAVSSQNTFAEGLAAVVPCYWLYLKMVEYYTNKLKKNKNKIYKGWAEVFKRKDFINLVEELIILLESEINSENYERIKYQFINSVKFEYQFFDDAYHKKIW